MWPKMESAEHCEESVNEGKRKVDDARTRRLVGAELRRLYEGGTTVQGLARATGRSPSYVRRLLQEAGTTLSGRLPSRTKPSPSSSSSRPRWVGRGTHLSPSQSRLLGARLRKLYEDGASIRDLVHLTDRSYSSVRHLLLEAGTTLRGRGGDNTRTWRPRPAR